MAMPDYYLSLIVIVMFFILFPTSMCTSTQSIKKIMAIYSERLMFWQLYRVKES